ncbi:MAG: maltokinase N-terminal cap-like domain-containing protein [Nocardioides sp.]
MTSGGNTRVTSVGGASAGTREENLAHLIRTARWFGGKGRDFGIAATIRLGRIGACGVIDLVEVRFDDGGAPEFYQIPLAFYREPHDSLGHAYLGAWEDPDFGHAHVYDATHDRDTMQAWLESFAANANAGTTSESSSGTLRFQRIQGHHLDLNAHSTLLTGEQSNTSVAFGEDSMLKIFRRITPGVNPDVEIHAELTRAGSDHVATLYGWLEFSPAQVNSETHAPDNQAAPAGGTLHLAMLQQFLRTATDGWDLAQASVRNLFAATDLSVADSGGDFAGEAARLGVALAQTHQTLANEFPTAVLDTDGMARLSILLHSRLDQALTIVPGLAPHAPRLRATYDNLHGVITSPTQRIHGDLHLGQTLRTVRGWKIVDFEGEPARPLAERQLPDSPWRDVAGMLRSFDYAPRAVDRTVGDGDPEDAELRAARAAQWAARNQEAFLSAYAGRDLASAEKALLAAYVADKAVYETVYETRNRPTWVPIPLGALAKIGAA